MEQKYETIKGDWEQMLEIYFNRGKPSVGHLHNLVERVESFDTTGLSSEELWAIETIKVDASELRDRLYSLRLN